MLESIKHIEHRLGGANSTGASTTSAHQHNPNANPHPYGNRKMFTPTNPSSVSDPNTNSGHLFYASASDPSYGQPGGTNQPRNTGGNPPSGKYSVSKSSSASRQPYVEDASDHEAGPGSVDRLDTGGTYGRETLEDYGYYDSGIDAGHGTGLGVSQAAASNLNNCPATGPMEAGKHRFGEERSSVRPGARVGREPGAEASSVDMW